MKKVDDIIRWMEDNKFISLIYQEEDQEITLISHTEEPFGRTEFMVGSETYNKFIELETICSEKIGRDFKIIL